MNLHGIVSGAIGTINPSVPATLRRSTGYTTAADGTQTPTYATAVGEAQVQALSSKDLRLLDSLNIQGSMFAVYLYGNWDGIVRPAGKGGDILVFGEPPQTWLVTQTLETWPDWCKVAVTLQNGR